MELSQYIVFKGSREPLKCVGVDVTQNGIGVIGFEELPLKTSLLFLLENREIELNVAWCKGDKVRTGVYHSGLQCTDHMMDLPKLLESAGLLQIVQPWNFRVLANKKK